MDFKEEAPWNILWLVDKEKFWIRDALDWLRQWHFDLGDNHLIVSPIKLFLFFPLFPVFLFGTQKYVGEGGIAPSASPQYRSLALQLLQSRE